MSRRLFFVYFLFACVYTEIMAELLAPAGDIASFEAALSGGADAVYLGLSDFNARRKAQNFSADNLRSYVERAHFFGVKVYVTFNTLIKDDEIPSFLGLARAAVEAKADAFIVQDLGAAACLKTAFPNVALHASTQLGVHNLYGARQAERLGFKRVVLSRETKRDDIREIKKNTGLELEYFVQGALCIAFSGNCYLSAQECGASGNRGLCKQLCRLPYVAKLGGDTKSGYLLSARDMCLANSLGELADAGVASFKIEGRMRRADYVRTAVGIYRRLLNGIYDSRERLAEDDMKSLKIAYSRGDNYLTRGYLDGGAPSVVDSAYNNHTGLEVGAVKDVKNFKTDLYRVTVVSHYPLKSGDGLKFFSEDGKEAASVGLNDIKSCGENLYSFVTKTRLTAGWKARLISRAGDTGNNDRRVLADIKVEAVAGKPLFVEASCVADGNRISATVYGDMCEAAKTAPTGAEELRAQACRTGDSGFYAENCDVETDGAFVPKSVINSLRRQALEELKSKLIAYREIGAANVDYDAYGRFSIGTKNGFDCPKMQFIRQICDIKVRNRDVLNVLCPSEYTSERVKHMLEECGLMSEDIALQLPVIANGKDIKVIRKLLADMPRIRTLVSENIYGLEFAREGYKVIAGAGHNALNAYAADTYTELGAAAVLPSLESGRRENIIGCELPLMTFAHCPFKTVYDCECGNCAYKEGMTYAREGREYLIRRTRVSQCYFGLFPKKLKRP